MAKKVCSPLPIPKPMTSNSTIDSSATFADFLDLCQERVNKRLHYWLSQPRSLAPTLLEAMHYATFNGGKRIRPVLVYAAVNAVGGAAEAADDIAAALEMVHSYSLVHDDLPAMDNDDLRRGKPTCHIQFDEATAILAGDALQCLAFEVISQAPLPAEMRIKMVEILARASGTEGMAGGQALDLAAEGRTLNLEELENIHAHKTGSLIQASVQLGAMTHPETSARQITGLDQFAQAIGLAFQVQDDILDIIGSTQEMGKTQGADHALGKATYPSIMGLEAAQALARDLCTQAITALSPFDERAEPLRALAHYIVTRTH